MKSLISFSRPNLLSLIPLSITIFSTLIDVFLNLYSKTGFNGHFFIMVGIISITQIMGGIFEVISKCRQHRNSKKINSEETKYISTQSFTNLKQKIPQTYNTIKYILLILVIGLCNFSCIFFVTGVNFLDPDSERYLVPFLSLIQMLLVIIFSIIILKYQFYKHHFISILIIALGIFIYYAHYINFGFSLSIAIRFIGYSLFSLQQVLEKYIFNQNFISPFKLVFYKGLINFFLIMIIGVVSFLTMRDNNNIVCMGMIIENYASAIEQIKKNKLIILYLIFILFGYSGYYLFCSLSIYYFLPTYIFLYETIDLILTSIFDLIFSFDTITFDKYYYISIVGLVFILLGGLLYNEIIILHFCKLDYQTKKEIEKRADLEKDINIITELLPKQKK